MRHLICVALLCVVGCSAVPAAPPAAPAAALASAPVVNGEHEKGIQAWIPGIFTNLWDTFDARLGVDYGFGAHLKVTDLARIGIFDYSDFSLLGFDRDIFYGHWNWPHKDGWHLQTSYDLAFKVGVGFGFEAALHTYEVVDWLCWTLSLGYLDLN
jgi:hypothetical protein